MDSDRREALDAKGPDYRPRTRHLDAAGRPRFVNRLIFETSPYLLQHAHNPVDWYAWGDEPFERARREGKPVFLSVGYATCHWCHVMEEESFEDEAIAALLAARFVAVKVDREERPDVDAVYMTALQATSGRGGWPMSAFLTPSRRPFFLGTYFPPRAGVRGAQRGFTELLTALADAYSREPAAIEEDAEKLTRAVASMLGATPAAAPASTPAALLAVRFAAQRFDAAEGGVRGAPKFPSSFPTRLLLAHAAATGEPHPRAMAMSTLARMRDGGIHDALAGGFHRYSTDTRWLVPHFEKMLYDNALLAATYLDAGDEAMIAVARRTLDYLAREMRSPEGTFYSATDADSVVPSGAHEEGYYFTFTIDELRVVLGDDAALAAAYFGVTAAGNFEGRSVLTSPRDPELVAASFGLGRDELAARIEPLRARLLEARAARPAPLRDEKVVVSWNALAVSAFARAGALLADADLAEVATRAYARLIEPFRSSGRLPHLLGARRPGEGFAEDYAFLAAAALDVFELTAELEPLEDAIALVAALESRFVDPTSRAYRTVSSESEPLIAAEIPLRDGAVPSANSIAALVLLRLAEWLDAPPYRERAGDLLRVFGSLLPDRAPALEYALLAAHRAESLPESIVIVVPEGRGALAPSALPFVSAVGVRLAPPTAVLVASEAALATLAARIPNARDKRLVDGRATVYVCTGGSCRAPITDVDALRAVLGER